MTTATDPVNTLSVPGFTMYVILEAARKASGTQFAHVLKQADLSRFAERSPDPSNEPVATPMELLRLFTHFYETLGEQMTRMAFRTWGKEIAHYMLAPQPWGDNLRAAVQGQPPAQQLGVLIRAIGELSNTYWSPTVMHETPTAWYMTLMPCTICLGICELIPHLPAEKRPTGPLCSNLEGAIPAIVYQVLKQRIVVTEVACAAAGAPHCQYAIYKPQPVVLSAGR